MNSKHGIGQQQKLLRLFKLRTPEADVAAVGCFRPIQRPIGLIQEHLCALAGMADCHPDADAAGEMIVFRRDDAGVVRLNPAAEINCFLSVAPLENSAELVSVKTERRKCIAFITQKNAAQRLQIIVAPAVAQLVVDMFELKSIRWRSGRTSRRETMQQNSSKTRQTT